MRQRQGQGTTDTGYSACQGPQHRATHSPHPGVAVKSLPGRAGTSSDGWLGRGRFRGG